MPIAVISDGGAFFGIKLMGFPAEVPIGLLKALRLGISRNTGSHNGCNSAADGKATQCPKHRSSGQFHSHSSFRLICSFWINIFLPTHEGVRSAFFIDIG